MTYYYESELYHHGILGQKWGVRRYQNADGTLTAAGKKHYAKDKAVRKNERQAAGSGSLTNPNNSFAARKYQEAKGDLNRLKVNPGNDYEKYLRDMSEVGSRREAAFKESKANFKANKTLGQKAANLILNGPIGAGVYNNLRASGYSVGVSAGVTAASKILAGPVGSTAAYIITRKGV